MFNRDAVSDLALHFLNKMKIMVVKDIERDEIEFICKVLPAREHLDVKEMFSKTCFVFLCCPDYRHQTHSSH